MYTSDENDANNTSESDSITSNNETSATRIKERKIGSDNKVNKTSEEIHDNEPDIDANNDSDTNNEPCKKDNETEKETEDPINFDEFDQMIKDVNNAETEMHFGINSGNSSNEASICIDCNNSATDNKNIEEPSLLLDPVSGLLNIGNGDRNATDIDSLSNNDVVMNVGDLSKLTNTTRETVFEELIFNLDEFDKIFGMIIDFDKGQNGKDNDSKKDDSKNELIPLNKDELALHLNEFDKVLDNFKHNDKIASDTVCRVNETDKGIAENKGKEFTFILDTLDILNRSDANLRAINYNNELGKEVNIKSNNSSNLYTMEVDVEVKPLSNSLKVNKTAIKTNQIESKSKDFPCNSIKLETKNVNNDTTENFDMQNNKTYTNLTSVSPIKYYTVINPTEQDNNSNKNYNLANEQHVNLTTVNLQNNNEVTLNEHKISEILPKIKNNFAISEDFEETNIKKHIKSKTRKTTEIKPRDDEVISISSEEASRIKDSSENEGKTKIEKQTDSDDGYRSSDFEFISENEAKKEGLVNKYENFNLPGPSNKLDNDATRQSKYENVNLPGPSNRLDNIQGNYQYNNSYRENHVVPQGDEYLNLFRGIYMPWDLAFLENKSVVAPPRMNAEYYGVGFNVGMMRLEKNSDDGEFIHEANKNAKKIRMMYPADNKKRRRY